MLQLSNTLSRKKEIFKPLHNQKVGLYTCGPTVYNYSHIGNLRTYIFEDILRRTLEFNGYRVKHVMNITDVGHLTSDADTGEDKMEKGARREKKTVWEIARFYTQAFKQNLKDLNILKPHIWCKATDHIKEQINLVKKLEQKGVTYKTRDGIYFDVSKFKNYGKLARLDIKGLKAGARIKVQKGKRQPTDFALWKFSAPNGRDPSTSSGPRRQMEWDSPWGKGFPGWHLECSVMSTKYLGQPFDIHCGGIDHIPVHHTNEIAQSEVAFNKKMANFWLHGEFLIIKAGKMAKSKENFITLQTLKDKGFHPLAFRYLALTTHYRQKLNFSWESLKAAQNTLEKLFEIVSEYGPPRIGCAEFEQKFQKAINNDLDTPKTLALMWKLIKSNYPSSAKKQILLVFDKILGLNLAKIKKPKISIPSSIKKLILQREKARKQKDFQTADKIRNEIIKKGFIIEDTPQGPKLKIKK